MSNKMKMSIKSAGVNLRRSIRSSKNGEWVGLVGGEGFQFTPLRGWLSGKPNQWTISRCKRRLWRIVPTSTILVAREVTFQSLKAAVEHAKMMTADDDGEPGNGLWRGDNHSFFFGDLQEEKKINHKLRS